MTDWEKRNELKLRTVDALITGYKKDIVYDYCIPSPRTIESEVVKAAVKLCGGVENKLLYFIYPANALHHLNQPDRIQKRILKGLLEIFSGANDEYNFLQNQLFNSYSSMTEWQWYYGKGDVFKFRKGERAAAEKRVRDYFTNEELDDYKKMHKLIKGIIKND